MNTIKAHVQRSKSTVNRISKHKNNDVKPLHYTKYYLACKRLIKYHKTYTALPVELFLVLKQSPITPTIL